MIEGLAQTFRPVYTKKTVEKILESLTPEQHQKWQTLVGEPFEG